MFHIAQYPVHWADQSALHFTPWQACLFGSPFIQAPTRLLWEAFSHTEITARILFTHIASYSFVQLSELGHRGENENAQASKQQQRGFEPGLSRLSPAFYH